MTKILDQTLDREISKADVDRFLFKKHLTSCAVCGRYRSNCDVDVKTLSCQRTSYPEVSVNASLSILMIVCENCGAIQFHDRAVIANWLECPRNRSD